MGASSYKILHDHASPRVVGELVNAAMTVARSPGTGMMFA
jgi:hypothetical protein